MSQNKNGKMFALFGESGPFSQRFSGYIPRGPQQKLAQSVWDACVGDGGLLVAEAPPGVGKTFALLGPALLHSVATEKRILVLTGSIPLQEQLLQKDLPQLMDVLDIHVPYALLKGRSRYACKVRAKELGKAGELLAFQGDQGSVSAQILQWLQRTRTGDLEELSLPQNHPGIFQSGARSQGCLGRRCPEWEGCFVQGAIRRAGESQVVVANYHLFFAYTLGAGMPFPVPFDILICDEAHGLVEAARSSISRAASVDQMNRLLGASITRQLVKCAQQEHLGWEDLEENLKLLKQETEALFERALGGCGRGKTFKEPVRELALQSDVLVNRLGRLAHILRPLSERSGDEETSPEGTSLLVWLEEAVAFGSHCQWCCHVAKYPEWAYWWDGSGFESVPGDCAPWISQVMRFDQGEGPMIASSATLAVNGSFAYWQRQTGLVPRKSLVLGTPFDLRKQMEIWVVDMGMKVVHPHYDSTLARAAEKLILKNGGRTLFLVSSRRLLNTVKERLLQKKWPYRILFQGDLPRSELLQIFREDPESVLVGTVSFREGVDIPGDGLTQVIIDRIPFPHPNNPVVEARNEMLGKKAFMEETLPWAIMLLKQAVGRLVRSHQDMGKVVILDGRVVQKRNWGILEALPRVRIRFLRLTR